MSFFPSSMSIVRDRLKVASSMILRKRKKMIKPCPHPRERGIHQAGEKRGLILRLLPLSGIPKEIALRRSYSDVDRGWGNASPRSRDRKKSTPPREDRRDHRQRSPTGSRHSGRSHGSVKRPGSPSRNPQPSKKANQREAWMTGGKRS
jgi:hypothetical protein